MLFIHVATFLVIFHDVSPGVWVGILDLIISMHVPSIPTKHFAKKVQVGKDQEKAQSEKDSHSKNRGGKKPN